MVWWLVEWSADNKTWLLLSLLLLLLVLLSFAVAALTEKIKNQF
jgi:hypothetical protein